jgi:two-component system, OmpR family, response regulator
MARHPGRAVLLVEDDAALRMLCRVNLELEDYRILEADTLAAARAVLSEQTPDVVLLDIHLGKEDGRELLAELRARDPSLPVALFTGTAAIEEALKSDADGVLRKPFSLEELSATVGRLVRGGPQERGHPARPVTSDPSATFERR